MIIFLKKNTLTILAIVGSIVMGSCENNKEELLYPEEFRCENIQSISYANVIAPILSEFCMTCHKSTAASGLGGGYKLDSYTDVKDFAESGSLTGVIQHQEPYTPMPLNGKKLSDCNIQIILKWIEEGIKNN